MLDPRLEPKHGHCKATPAPQYASAKGKYKGRKPTAKEQPDKVLALKSAGVPRDKIQEQLGISRASYYRIVAAA